MDDERKPIQEIYVVDLFYRWYFSSVLAYVTCLLGFVARKRRQRAQKPTVHISYDEGLALIRQFLRHASNHTVEELQAFTSQWVPCPRWVRRELVTIPNERLTRAAEVLAQQLGSQGIERVGGKRWWQYGGGIPELRAEWIEMRNHYNYRTKHKEPCKRVMLYIHGGAYFFGSVDEHRYQMQRHARKLRARVFAPKYRLAPQFPFPCGLFDCLSAYLYLLTIQDPSTIILAGDSAGGGMVLSLLCVLRDQGIALPAGAILISPWVDLTHSFPSVAGDGLSDYIPAHGFMHRPSMAWPPPNEDEMAVIDELIAENSKGAAPAPSPKQTSNDTAKTTSENTGSSVEETLHTSTINQSTARPNDQHLSITIDGKVVNIKDQIQMYTSNQLLDHPLVSPVMQPSLGGLPPLMILTGGGELLKDEQVYLAHKAANPKRFPPSGAWLRKYPEAQGIQDKYPPTDVYLTVWEDLCHVAPTLSFTRPAKLMFRSIAQFGAWALARAQHTGIEILDDDQVSIVSDISDTESEEDEAAKRKAKSEKVPPLKSSGNIGDPLPRFKNHIIAQVVNRHGDCFPLREPDTALSMAAEDIGVIKPGPVKKWLAAKQEWDTRFAKQKARLLAQRAKKTPKSAPFYGADERPPPNSQAARREALVSEPKKRSLGLSLWSLWGSSHDKDTLEREENADKQPEKTEITADPGSSKQHLSIAFDDSNSRSRSRHRTINYQQQMDETEETAPLDERINKPAADFAPASSVAGAKREPVIDTETKPSTADESLVLPGTNITLDSPTATRPKADGIAFPFKLKRDLLPESNTVDAASVLTLRSEAASIEEEQQVQPLPAENSSK